jgi:hypothetical protein
MRVRFNIDFELSPRVKRALRLAVPAVIVLGASAAYASVPSTFKDGDALSAQALNDDFGALDQRLAKLESLSAKETADGGYSIGAKFCGASASTTKGDLSGLAVTGTTYTKLRTQCQVTCGAPSAHLCSGEELTRTTSLGMATGVGWYSGGVAPGGGFYECIGWTTVLNTQNGPLWSGAGPNAAPSFDTCDKSHPVLCCN